MDRAAHKHEAEAILEAIKETSNDLQGRMMPTTLAANMNEVFANQIALAQVHATLATIPDGGWTE